MDLTRFETRRPGRVVLRRGGMEESVHAVHGVASGPGGELLGWFGDPDRSTMLRSAAKPFQALPLVDDGAADAFGLEADELALTCGSHGGEPRHVALARRILERGRIPETALACGPHPPMHAASARDLAVRGEGPGRIHNNCSGKHAGMLLLAQHHGWPPTGYHEADHPVQRRMRTEVARWTGRPEEELGCGVDGCGVVCFSAPLRSLARAFAALGAAAEGGEPGPARVAEAMTRYPEAVAGTGRLCTAVMRAGEGRVLAKVGAEGVYGAVVHAGGRTIGLGLKVEDGARRAAEATLLAMLDAVAPGWARRPGASEDAGLTPWTSGVVPNTRGEAAAALEVELPQGWWSGGLPESRPAVSGC